MNLYDFDDYQTYLRQWLEAQPKLGRGILRAWSLKFAVHPSLLSQVLSGKRSLTLELADQIGEELNLGENEALYFQLLVLQENAGTKKLKDKFRKRILDARARSKKISERVRTDIELSEEAKSVFYSSWLYAGLRNLTAIPEFRTVDALAARLGLPRALVAGAIEFLVTEGLCRVGEGGAIEVGPQRTFVPAGSPLVERHHQNWRLHGFTKMKLKRPEDLFLTIPMSLSVADAEKLRTLLPSWFQEVNKIIGPSESQTVRCLNLDFFEY